MKQKYLIFLVIMGLLASNLAFGQGMPKTIDEAKESGVRALDEAPEAFQESLEEARPIWTQVWNWIKKWASFAWGKVRSFLDREVEKRKPGVKDEFKKEAEEIKEEVPSLWQRFKDLIYWKAE